MLNGRCKSDLSGATTFEYSMKNGSKGHTTVDYALVYITENYYDLSIEDGFNNIAGHSALSISM